ncbi:MAG: CotH kinase family protein [Bacteroidota bacterium]
MNRTLTTLLIGIALLHAAHGQVLTSSNLPIVVVNTNGQGIPNEPRIKAQLGIVYNGEGVRNGINDPRNHYNGLVGIEVRGQSSQGFPMKSYDLELWKPDSSENEVSLFRFPKESDYALYAPYTDKTLMRNFLSYTFTRELGRWAARCRYVELVVDNDYKGIYVFMEKIKRDSGRVNIAKLGPNENSGDALTGGYIISVDKGANGWFSAIPPMQSTNGQRIQFNYVYPQIDSITIPQKNYIKSYVDSFEQALGSSSFQHPQWGWRRHADESSFIDYLIVNELAKNIDGYRLSTYLYKDKQTRGGILVAGPVWDYDLAFYNANYCRGSDTVGWAWQFNSVCPADYWQVPYWWNQFQSDTAFQGNFRCRWKQLRATSLSDLRINRLIDSVVNLTQEARIRHFQRWPVIGQYIWPNVQPVPMSYSGEIQQLRNWFAGRIAWIERNLPNRGICFEFPGTTTNDLIVSAQPNPFRNALVLSLKSRKIQSIELAITDATGRLMHRQKIYLNYGDNRPSINTDSWSTGIYFVRIGKENGSSEVVRVVKQ